MPASNKGEPRAAGSSTNGEPRPERLQKLLARAGYGSRRKCEEIITAGRVKVDGRVITELGSKADPACQRIQVDGKDVQPEEVVYYLFHKPKGVLCTCDDPLDRKTVLSFFPEEDRRVFPVGRLDYESKGAVILTNDGRLTQLLTHPRYGVERTYWVRVRGVVDDYALQQLRSGIQLSEGRTSPAKVWVMKRREDETELGLTLSEGRNRQVRRMLAAVGHKVRALTRTRIGTLTLKGIGIGQARRIQTREIKELLALAKERVREPRPPQDRDRRPRIRHGKPDPKKAHELDKARGKLDAAIEAASPSEAPETEAAAPKAPEPSASPQNNRHKRRFGGRGRRKSDAASGRRGRGERRKTQRESNGRQARRSRGRNRP